MITLNMGNRGDTPKYEYIYKCIREEIMEGNLLAGEKLPSKRSMAENHNIGLITVENAYAQLMLEGYIYSEEKKGYFVSKEILAAKAGNAVSKDETYDYRQDIGNREKYDIDFGSSTLSHDHFPFSTWARVTRSTLLDKGSSLLDRSDNRGVFELRCAIAESLRKIRGFQCDPENIIVGAGMEYLYGMIIKILGQNRIIALEDPGHKKTGMVYESSGAKCVRIPLDKSGIEIKKLYNSGARMAHISPSHQYPTGIVMPAGRRSEILKWASDTDSYVVEDDYDSEFRFLGRPVLPLCSLDRDRVIYMNTFTKTLAPSIRIAYMVLPTKLMRRFQENLGFYSCTVSSQDQYTLADFIEREYYERHINRMRKRYREIRKIMMESIKESGLLKLMDIEGEDAGLHFVLRCRKKIDEKKFLDILRRRKINILRMSDYCYNNKRGANGRFMINYIEISREKMLEASKAIIEAYKASVIKHDEKG